MSILETVTAARTARVTLEESRARRAEEREALRRQHDEDDATEAAAAATLWGAAVDAIFAEASATFPKCHRISRALSPGGLQPVAHVQIDTTDHRGNTVIVRFAPSPPSVGGYPPGGRPAIIAEIDRSAAGYGNSVAEALRHLVTELRADGRFAPCKALLSLYETRVSHE